MDYIIDVDYDISAAEAKTKRLNRQYEEQRKLVKEAADEAKKTTDYAAEQKAALDGVNERYKEELSKLRQLKNEAEKIPLKTEGNIRKHDELKAKIAEVEKAVTATRDEQREQATEVERSEAAAKKATNQYNKQYSRLESIGIKIKENTDKSKSHAQSWLKTNRNIQKSQTSVQQFGKRIGSLVKSALIFSVITKFLTQMRKALSSYLTQNKKISETFAKLKGNIATIGATIMSSLAPYIQWVLDKLVYLSSVLGNILAKLLNKNASQMAEIAESAENAADATDRMTAGFDTLQTITGNNSATAINTGAITSFDSNSLGFLSALAKLDFSFVNECLEFLYYEILDPLANWTITNVLPAFLDLLSSVLETLGIVIDAAKPTLEWLWDEIVVPIATTIGNLLVDVIELITEKLTEFSDWAKENPEKIQNISDIILGLLAGIVAYQTIHKVATIINTIKTAMVKWISGLNFSTIFSTAGAVLALAGAFIFWKENWGKIKNSFNNMSTWEKAITIILGVAAAVAVLITAITVGVGAAGILTGLASLGIGAWILSRGTSTTVSSPSGATSNANAALSSLSIGDYSVPALATGAVIPGGSPFLAMLGDQPKGKTNIEAPLDTLVEAFKAAQGTQTFTIQATGSMAPLIRMLNLKVQRENNRASVF